MFRFVFVILAIFGLVSLLSGAVGTVAAGIGGLALLSLLAFKLFFFLAIFGFIGRRMWGWNHGPRRPRPGPWGRPREEAPQPSAEEKFEDWHRLAHAREEVDSWVDGLPDVEQE